MKPKIFTIGVYGLGEADFFDALQERQIDTFCDVRLRRGMRGAKYAFVNSKYLQKKLASLGINYLHFKELAPSKETRDKQKSDDKDKSVKKRERRRLSPAFIEAYKKENLANFDSTQFIEQFSSNAQRIVLFCVEREAEACHRSLIAQRLTRDLGLEVEHIIP